MYMLRAFVETFVTLLVIMDPLGIAPIFVGLTVGLSAGRRRRAALEASIVAGGLIIGFALAGRLLLSYLHVSVESLSIAGGLLLLLVSLDMVYDLGKQERAESMNISLVPLATPLLAGPGAIAAIMVEIQRYPAASEKAMVLAATVAMIGVIAAFLLAAGFLARRVKPSVVHLLSRVLGFLLAGIAIQLVVDAVRTLVHQG
ncbi:MAG: MarC family protein [Candidatus Dormibacteria bacterium]